VKVDNLGREIARGLYSSSSGLSASTDRLRPAAVTDRV
jgi:hypothetical protein